MFCIGDLERAVVRPTTRAAVDFRRVGFSLPLSSLILAQVVYVYILASDLLIIG